MALSIIHRIRPIPLLLAAMAYAASAGSAAPSWVFRLDQESAGLAREADSLKARGFRLVSLDAYGNGNGETERFAAAWVRKPGPDWISWLSLGEGELHDSLRACAQKGFQPILLTASGVHPRFSAVLEKGGAPARTLTGLTWKRFQAECDSAQRNGALLIWMDAYGLPQEPVFAGIWKSNRENIPWNYSMGDDEKTLQSKLTAFSQVWVRPALIVPIPGGKYFTLWQENAIGTWLFHPALKQEACASDLDREGAKGMHPVCLSVMPTGTGMAALSVMPGSSAIPASEGPVFTVLLAARDRPLPREWTVTGPAVPGLDVFDDYMRKLMQTHQVRAGALAMVRDAKLVFARGYTWAEEGYPQTQPTSLFRVASCSKPLTSMVIHRLLGNGEGQKGALDLKEKVLTILRPSMHPGDTTPADARFRDITVDDLLTHAGGWIRSRQNPDPVFNDYPPGNPIDRRLPPTRDGFLDYMLHQPLQFDPGSRSVYANFGYFLLGRIIESLPPGHGRTYQDVVEEFLFKPLGLSRPRFGSSASRAPGEVMYHTRLPYLQRNRDPAGPPWVPGAYGDFSMNNMDAAGAWVLSATDFAKVLASFDLGNGNPVLPPEAVATMWAPPRHAKFMRGWFATRMPGGNRERIAKWHSGFYPGTSTLVFYRPDKWSFALFLNRDIPPQLTGEKQGRELSLLADQVANWPSRDLFPEAGLAPFGPSLWAGNADPDSLGPAPDKAVSKAPD